MKTTHEQRIMAIKAIRQGERGSKFNDELNDLIAMLESMEDFDEIQRIHDVLHFANIDLPDKDKRIVFGPSGEGANAHLMCFAAMEALCWVLRHPARHTFDKNVLNVQHKIEQLGYKLGKVEPDSDGPGIS